MRICILEGITLGVIIGAGATLIGTIITASMNVFIANGQYKRELNKTFLQKKVETYANVCKTITTIQNEYIEMSNNGTANSSKIENWAHKGICLLADITTTEGLWLTDEEILKIESLSWKLYDCRDITQTYVEDELAQDCLKIVQYFANKNKKLHKVKNKKIYEDVIKIKLNPDEATSLFTEILAFNEEKRKQNKSSAQLNTKSPDGE